MSPSVGGGRALVVLVTAAGEAEADALARGAVELRLAACVQSLPIRSTFYWQGALEQGPEHLLLLKTDEARFPALRDWIVAAHGYEVPEILALPVADGSVAYLDWLHRSLG